MNPIPQSKKRKKRMSKSSDSRLGATPVNVVRLESLITRIESNSRPLAGPPESDLTCRVAIASAADTGIDVDPATGKIRYRFNNKFDFCYRLVWMFYNWRPGNAPASWSWSSLDWSQQKSAFEQARNEIKDKAIVHSCDVPNCIRREHLSVDTMAANIANRGCPGWILNDGASVLTSGCTHQPHCTRVTHTSTPARQLTDEQVPLFKALADAQAAARAESARVNKEVRAKRSQSKRKFERPNSQNKKQAKEQ